MAANFLFCCLNTSQAYPVFFSIQFKDENNLSSRILLKFGQSFKFWTKSEAELCKIL